MTNAELVAAVKDDCNIAAAVTDYDASILSWINRLQKKLAAKELMPILESQDTITTTAAQNTDGFTLTGTTNAAIAVEKYEDDGADVVRTLINIPQFTGSAVVSFGSLGSTAQKMKLLGII